MQTQIPKNWQKVKLGEVIEFVDGDRGNNYPKNEELSRSGYCLFLNTKNVPGTRFSFSNSDNQFITEEKDERLRKGRLKRGDFVLTTRGTVGNFAFFSNDIPYENIRINSGMVILRPKQNKIYPLFFKQYLGGKNFGEQVNSLISGSAQPQLPLRDLSQLELTIIPLPEQKQIANVLSAFDDKIEVNNKIAKTLEEMAQAIFKEWFLKFKFPGYEKVKFVDGEFGKIPIGWSIGVLNNFIGELESGKRPRGGVSRYKEGVPSIGAENISGLINSDYSNIKYIPTDFFESMNTGKIKKNDILIYKDGGVPGIFKVKFTIVGEGYPFLKAAINEHVFRLQANKSERQLYLYFWLNTHLSIRYFDSIGGKAAVPGINSTDLKNLPILIPNENIVVLFHRLACPLIKKILNINLQNQILSKTRDLLLPKLLRGEIKV